MVALGKTMQKIETAIKALVAVAFALLVGAWVWSEIFPPNSPSNRALEQLERDLDAIPHPQHLRPLIFPRFLVELAK